MTLIGLSASAFLGLLAGVSIGCVGVGGVILVPALILFAGIPIHTAISSAMAGYILTGVAGGLVFLKRGSLSWGAGWPLWVGAIPAAIFGSLITRVTPSFILEFVIALLTLTSGLQSLIRRPPAKDCGPSELKLSNSAGVSVGLVTGFLSALTGTGGPAVLIPLLLWLEVPVLLAIGLAQGIQLPIAVLATVGNAAGGTLQPLLALVLGSGLFLGAWLGARLAHELDQLLLRRVVAILLFGTGVLMLFKIASKIIAGA